MIRTVFPVFVLMVVVVTFALAKDEPLPWGIAGLKPTTIEPATVRPTRGRCPEPTAELQACVNQWTCQQLLRLDLRCLLNLNGLPLVGNVLGGLLGGGGGGGGGGQTPGQPGLGGSGGGLLGGGLLGGPGGLLGSLLG